MIEVLEEFGFGGFDMWEPGMAEVEQQSQNLDYVDLRDSVVFDDQGVNECDWFGTRLLEDDKEPSMDFVCGL